MRSFFGLGALVPLGFGLYTGGRQAWGWHHDRQGQSAAAAADFAAAGKHWQTCFTVWPDSPDVHLVAAHTSLRSGNTDDALEHLKACQQVAGLKAASGGFLVGVSPPRV
jgi:hypothetical protein